MARSSLPSDSERSSVSGATTQPAAASAMPQDFDAASFERIAKMIFIRLQAANDDGNLDDLRKFTTPELFASLRLDLQERGGVAQQTDVVQLDAKVVETVQEPEQWVVTVRFTGLVREQSDSGAEAVDELWHMQPRLGHRRYLAGVLTNPAGLAPALGETRRLRAGDG